MRRGARCWQQYGPGSGAPRGDPERRNSGFTRSINMQYILRRPLSRLTHSWLTRKREFPTGRILRIIPRFGPISGIQNYS